MTVTNGGKAAEVCREQQHKNAYIYIYIYIYIEMFVFITNFINLSYSINGHQNLMRITYKIVII